MRVFLVLLVVVAALLGMAWLGGETLLSRRAATFTASDPSIDARAVTPLRQIDRIGLGLTDASVATSAGTAQFPALSLWAEPSRPNRFHATLPPTMTLPVAGRMQEVAATNADLSARLSPLHSMALTGAAVKSGPVTISGAPALAGIDVTTELVKLGNQAPRAARSAYAVTADVSGLMPGAFAADLAPHGGAVLAQPVGARGVARVYLDRAFVPGATEPPQLQGLQSDGLTLTLGDLSARVLGRVERDEAGFASGMIYVYTADARAFLDAAAAAGLLPAGAVPLINTMLTNLADQPGAEAMPPADTRTSRASEQIQVQTRPAGPPEPEPGELRLPVEFRNGKASVGGMPIGNAPRLG